jgi:RND family efflux transporter MFP subunit
MLLKKSRFQLIFGLFVYVVFIAACSPPEKSEIQPKKQVSVQVIKIKTKDLPVIVESVGRLAANREVVISAEVGGIVMRYQADIGDKVKAGQFLVEIDPVDYRLALREAKANLAAAVARLNNAEKTYNRSKTLLPRKVISHDTFEKAEAGYQTAIAVVDQVKALVNITGNRLDKTKITVPFKGLVAARMVEKGQMIAPGQPVMTIVDLSRVRVKVYIPELNYVHLDQNDPVTVIVDAYPEKVINGRVDRIGIKADERTNTFAIEILVENPDLILKAGLSARVRLTTRTISDTILIPQSCILYKNEQQAVFIVDSNNKARLRVVGMGRSEGSMIQITNGLKPGDSLVITGGQYLEQGDTVTISTPEPAKPA